MSHDRITLHFDNRNAFTHPILLYQTTISGEIDRMLEPATTDAYGPVFHVPTNDEITLLRFKFADENPDHAETDTMIRSFSIEKHSQVQEVWVRSWNAFIYTTQPRIPDSKYAEEVARISFVQGAFISNTGGYFALGATPLQDGGVLFGLFHPHAARVYVTGEFNDWQHPGADETDPEKFLEMTLHTGYFNAPNVWLLPVENALVGQTYKFYLQHETISGEHLAASQLMPDPYTRFLAPDYDRNDSLIVDPSTFEWHDNDYHTLPIHALIIYELHVHGLTHQHPTVPPEHQGKYTGVIDLIESGYFDTLGITCLYLMPISEAPTPQGENALGYNTSLFMAIERDFGTPNELRQLVNVAHQHGLAVIIDQVFNHAANSWNPLWKFILDHPDEAQEDTEGGLYFSGASPWGNRIATEREETQNMLIDACKMMLVEYHLDGFRFDATHTNYMNHDFLQRLADELQAQKPDVILIAENLPNQPDLNRDGYNGYAQWCDFFHDTIKAFLRESSFEGTDNQPEKLGDIFYFSKGRFADHTNNVVNYCESHDEHSVSYEVGFVENLSSPSARERKSRLGLFSTIVALGQPMIYMGQEFGVERERNRVYFDFPENINEHGYYQWASRLLLLRRRYSGLTLHGFNPIADGQFKWILGTWMQERQGGGKRVLGWVSSPTANDHDRLLILLNFENYAVEVDIPFDVNGHWVRLASIDQVNDVAPEGTVSIEDEDTLHIEDNQFLNFVLPDSSGFIYKWEASL